MLYVAASAAPEVRSRETAIVVYASFCAVECLVEVVEAEDARSETCLTTTVFPVTPNVA